MLPNPSITYIEKFGMALGVITAAFLIVLLPTLTAPHHRRVVANLAYLIGLAAVAYSLTFNIADFWLPSVLAVLAGGTTSWRIQSVLTHHSSGTR